MFTKFIVTLAVPSVLFFVAGCAAETAPEEQISSATNVDAPVAESSEEAAENTSDESPESALHLTGKKKGGGTTTPTPRACLKCVGCSVSWGWNACCEVVEVACSSLPKAQ